MLTHFHSNMQPVLCFYATISFKLLENKHIIMVKYKDEELLELLEKCEEEFGKVSSSILNDTNNEYPTQPTYQYRFGSLSEAMEEAGLEYEKKSDNRYSKKEIRERTKEYFSNNGSIYLKDFASADTDLPTPSAMYKKYDGIEELFADAGIYDEVMESRRADRRERKSPSRNEKYTEDDKDYLIDHLHTVNSKFGKVTTQTLQKADGPSKGIYNKIFGSIYEARSEAGITKEYTENFRQTIGELPQNYDESADSHIYVIVLHADSGETFYYVGKSTNIEKRLGAHTSGESKIRHRKENEYDKIKNLPLEIDTLLKVVNMYKKNDETDTEFANRVSDREHITSYKIAAGLETSNILGGR